MLQNLLRKEQDIHDIGVEFAKPSEEQWRCHVDVGLWSATGTGKTKKVAKREAAEAALQNLDLQRSQKRAAR